MAAAVSVCLLGLATARVQPAAADKGRSGGPAAHRPAAATTQLLDLRVSVSPVPGSGATLHYRGTFSGAPLGQGTVSLGTKLAGGDATVTYVLTTPTGSLRGSGTVTLTYAGSTVNYSGTAVIVKGTGAYKTMRSTGLAISGRSVVSSQHTTLRLTGPVTS